MGKGARIRRLRRKPKLELKKTVSDRLTINFQKELRNSEIWDKMVAEFGDKKAEQILKQCKAEVMPG